MISSFSNDRPAALHEQDGYPSYDSGVAIFLVILLVTPKFYQIFCDQPPNLLSEKSDESNLVDCVFQKVHVLSTPLHKLSGVWSLCEINSSSVQCLVS